MNKHSIRKLLLLAVLALAGCEVPPAPPEQTSDSSATSEPIIANPPSREIPFHFGY
jgi:hypothetical protein